MKSINKGLKIFVSLLLFSITTFSFSQNRSEKNKSKMNPTIVLVHGLWTDGSIWNKVTESLQAEGFPVIAVQNPTTSLEDDIAATDKAILRAKGDVILVGHSWGGFVISEAGVSDKVKALVYITALVPEKGETITTLESKAPQTQIGDYIQNNDGNLTLSEAGIQKAFAGDLSFKEQKIIFATQSPASQNLFTAIAKNAVWKVKPSYYLITKTDKSLNPDLQRLMAKRANTFTLEVDASHVPMISKPESVIKIIKEAVKNLK